MILRRVIAHFRKQEWTAIALDFVIVVVGVFIGIQVSNWNGARADREREDAILTRLEADFLKIEAAARDRFSVTEKRIETIDALIRQLRQEAAPDVKAIAPLYFDATSYSRPVGLSPTYREIVSTGEMGLLRFEPLRVALTQYAEAPETQEIATNFVISQVTSYPTIGMVAAMAEYYSSSDQDWLEPRLAEYFAQPEMIERLLIVRGTQQSWLYWTSQSLEQSQIVLAAITEARGETREPDIDASPAGEAE